MVDDRSVAKYKWQFKIINKTVQDIARLRENKFTGSFVLTSVVFFTYSKEQTFKILYLDSFCSSNLYSAISFIS